MSDKNLSAIQAYLEGYLKAREQIQNEKDHLASLYSIVENVTTHLSFTAGRNPSKDKSKFESTMIDIVAEEEKTEKNLQKLACLQAAIENLISRVDDKKMQKLLRCRYVNGLKFEEIADEIDLSLPRTYSLHREALEVAELLYEGEIDI